MESVVYDCLIFSKVGAGRQILVKIPIIKSFTQIRPVGVDLLHASRRTDRHEKLIFTPAVAV
jgi:hypothetical protein